MLEYHPNKEGYPPMPATADPFIARLSVKPRDGEEMECLVFLDKKVEGYKAIVGVTKDASQESVFNMPIRVQQIEALQLAAAQIASIYLDKEMIPQIVLLGNNAHSQSDDTGKLVMVLGRDHEPSYPHVHIYGRGVKEHCYISDIPLVGPAFPAPGIAIRHQYKPQEGEPHERQWKNYEGKQREVAMYFAEALRMLQREGRLNPLVDIIESKIPSDTS